ncbi:MAG: 30S ribosomal protein S13 [Victivallales bacterium]|nr:30S ribosomal protein S13 [Victivallales bacterium]
MPRILGVDIPNNKQTVISLQYIYGIGPAIAKQVCEKANIDPRLKASELTEANIGAILNILQEQYMVEGDLRRQIANNIRRLIAIGSYRGTRHRKNLPVHGQRTRTNARTRKGSKKTVGAIRDRTERKTAASAAAAKLEGKPAAGKK